MLSERQRDEEGSVIIAMTIVMIVTLAVIALLVTVNGGLASARNDQNRINAFQYANAGIDQALYRVDTPNALPMTPVDNYVPTRCFPSACATAGSFVTAFTDEASEFEVIAEAVPDGQNSSWKVRSTGEDASGARRQTITTISATPLFVNGFLTLTNFETNGNQSAPFGYDSSLCPNPVAPFTGPGCDLTNGETQPVPTRIGTNGILTLASSTADDYFEKWLGADMYGRSTQEAADNDCNIGGGGQKCAQRGDYPDGWAHPHTNQQVVTMPSFSGVASCPGAGNGSFSNTTIPAGIYRCPDLDLSGTIGVTETTGNVTFLVDGSVTIATSAEVNVGQASTRFRIFQEPSGPAPAGTFCSSSTHVAKFYGLLSAPRMEINCGAKPPSIYGAVVARVYGNTGAHFDFHWDSQSQFAVNDGKFVVRNWRECPVTSTDC